MRQITNPIESIANVMAFSSKDWGESSDDAWIYGVVLGWNDESLEELKKRYGWLDKEIDRLKELHIACKKLIEHSYE